MDSGSQSETYDITMLLTEYIHILHHLQDIKIKFLKLFLIHMYKNPNLADIFTNLAEEKKLNSTKFIEFVFFQVCSRKSGYNF